MNQKWTVWNRGKVSGLKQGKSEGDRVLSAGEIDPTVTMFEERHGTNLWLFKYLGVQVSTKIGVEVDKSNVRINRDTKVVDPITCGDSLSRRKTVGIKLNKPSFYESY